MPTDLPISQLPGVTSLNGSELLPYVQNGVTYQGPVQDILDANLPLTSSAISVGNGNITPTTPQGASLGTAEKPFKEIFLQSGSISIESDVSGDPPTVISNVDGNLLVSAGGMQLVGSGSFNAVTASFSYLSGSFNHIGSQFNQGDTVTTGSFTLSSGSSLNINDGFYVNGNKQFNYGAFSSTLTQSGSANTTLSMSFNTNDVSGHGVSIISGSRIKVDNTGLYNLQFSAQLDRTTSGTNIATIWFAYTGSNIANSATDVTITGNAATNPVVAAWNYILPMSASSYVQILWSHDDNVDNKVELKAVASRTNPARPAVPSVIVTLTQVA